MSKKSTIIMPLEDLINTMINKKDDSVIANYIKILGGATDLENLKSSLTQYTGIAHKISDYLTNNVSVIGHLERCTDEQVNYITSIDTSDSKVIACAGSGKTKCILARVKFMVDHGLANKQNIYIITFSRKAADDLRQRVRITYPDYSNFCVIRNLCTIDKLAKCYLEKFKRHKSEDVSVLSIGFRNLLLQANVDEIAKMFKYKKIDHLFIDEAQDLNAIQYDIVCLLKKYNDTQCHFIGDPNQNIYQFRGSSPKYLLNHAARSYELTLNFRSTQEIIDFSEHFKPLPTSKSVSATGKTGQPVLIFNAESRQLHEMIIRYIRTNATIQDLSNIAIICPTRGIGTYEGVGLSILFNLFKKNNIPFVQYYDESGGTQKTQENRKPGHINLITYHGTKGLEFDTVFVMDFYQNLFNIKPTQQEHNVHQYLLYVATSRAINKMIICTYTNVHNGQMNNWLSQVPTSAYKAPRKISITELTFRNENNNQKINGITELIGEMDEEQLDKFYDVIDIRENQNVFSRKIYDDFSNIDRGKNEALFGIFCEELFYLQYYLVRRQQPRKIHMIDLICDSKFVIIENEIECKILRRYIKSNKLTWDLYDQQITSTPQVLIKLITKYFSRSVNLEDYIICTNEFVKIVDVNIHNIRQIYARYLNPVEYDYDYRKILNDFFYLIVVQYAYDNNHYYYITDHASDKQSLLNNGMKLYESINDYVTKYYKSKKISPKVNVMYPKLTLLGEIDFVDENEDMIVEIKCVRNISIRYYLQLLLYNFCYNNQRKRLDKLFRGKFKIINLLTGIEYYILLNISPANMFNILIELSLIGNLIFSNMNLVYDIETTGLIKTNGPFKSRPKAKVRSRIYSNNGLYYQKTYPEIIEIAIRDYDTGMILINNLIKSNTKIPNIVMKITGITNTMLQNACTIDEIKRVLAFKMNNFINCKMIAHNGNRFDNEIILYDKLVNSTTVTFLDSMKIIPLHIQNGLFFDDKSLNAIYKHFFNVEYKGHRALTDVDAIIRIMRHLRIKL